MRIRGVGGVGPTAASVLWTRNSDLCVRCDTVHDEACYDYNSTQRVLTKMRNQ